MDSTGQTIDFLLTGKCDTAAAKRFFRKALAGLNNPQPRVINVDKNRAYVPAVTELKSEGGIRPRCRLRQCKYLNNIVEQDHRTVKKRVRLGERLRFVPPRMANDPGYRSSSSDSQRTSEEDR